MDKQTAEFVARISYSAASEIGGLIGFLKEELGDGPEYHHYRNALLIVSRTMAEDVLNRIAAEHPEVMKRIEDDVERFGRMP